MLTPIYISFNFFLFRHFLRLLIGLAEVQNWNVMAKEERKKNHDKPSATTWNSKWNSKWNVQHVIGPCSAAKFKINCSHSQLLAMVFACLFVCTYVSSVTINFFPHSSSSAMISALFLVLRSFSHSIDMIYIRLVIA